MTYYDAWATDATLDDLRQVGLSEAREAFTIPFGVASRRGAFKGFQIDWGSYAAIMTRSEIEDFLLETHGPAGAYETAHAQGATHLADRMRELRAYIDGLPEGGWFKLVGRSSRPSALARVRLLSGP